MMTRYLIKGAMIAAVCVMVSNLYSAEAVPPAPTPVVKPVSEDQVNMDKEQVKKDEEQIKSDKEQINKDMEQVKKDDVVIDPNAPDVKSKCPYLDPAAHQDENN